MQKFSVAVDDFYRLFPSDSLRVRACMLELIERYRIKGKSAVRAEERYFTEAGNDLHLIDTDQHRSIFTALSRSAEQARSDILDWGPTDHLVEHWQFRPGVFSELYANPGATG